MKKKECIVLIMKKSVLNLLVLMISGLALWIYAPVNSIAKSIYLPTKVKIYHYDQSTGQKKLWYSNTWKRNKYGMVTSINNVEGNDRDKTSLKYTFSKGLMIKVKCTYQRNKGKKFTFSDKYKYNKNKKVISHHSYDSKGRLEGKELYTYKGKKLNIKKEYEKKTLTNTHKYQWNKGRLSGYYVTFRGNKKGERVKYYYKSGKLSCFTEKLPGDSRTFIKRVNTHGFITQMIDVETIDGIDLSLVDYTDSYSDYKFNAKGRLTSVTDYGFVNGRRFTSYKKVYSGYKKYTVPKGDPMVYNEYIYYDYPDEMVIIPTAN